MNLLLAVVLVLVNSFFVASEFAITRVRPTQVEEWVRDRRPGAGSVKHAVDRIDAYLAACQLGITMASLGLGVVGERAFEAIFGGLIGSHSQVFGLALAGALGFGVITVLHVVVGELAPKSASIAQTERIVLAVAPPMRVFYTATRPVVDLFNGLGNLLLKPFGIPPAREAGHVPHTENELRALVRESEESGLIDPEEQALTDNVFTFGDRCARDVMIPWPDVRSLTADTDVAGAVEQIRTTGLSRLPLCEPGDERDTVVGVVHAKDLLLALVPDSQPALRELARPVQRVRDTLHVDDLLERLREAHQQLALVVDEHDHPVGVIALEDAIEEIVGDIQDEFDPTGPAPSGRRSSPQRA